MKHWETEAEPLMNVKTGRDQQARPS